MERRTTRTWRSGPNGPGCWIPNHEEVGAPGFGPTGSIHDPPASHDGQTSFTLELRLSEEPKSGFSYTTMCDHAFTVTGGSATGARRLNPPSSVGWMVTVQPDSNGDVTIVQPITTDWAAQGAIFTWDGRPLSNRVELSVSGPEP